MRSDTRPVGVSADGTDYGRARRVTDRELQAEIEEDPGLCETDPAFWHNARVVLPRPKEAITIRLDADLLAWLRVEKGYQTRINAVLRAYMVATQQASAKNPARQPPP